MCWANQLSIGELHRSLRRPESQHSLLSPQPPHCAEIVQCVSNWAALLTVDWGLKLRRSPESPLCSGMHLKGALGSTSFRKGLASRFTQSREEGGVQGRLQEEKEFRFHCSPIL